MEPAPPLFDLTPSRGSFYRERSQPIFDYYNSSPRPAIVAIRELLEAWYKKFPDNGKKDLRKRFRSHQNRQHQAAFFELYIHELLVSMSYEVILHSEPDGARTRPDFLAMKDGKKIFFLEATLACASDEQTSTDSRVELAYKILDKINSPNFFLFIKSSGKPTSQPPAKKLGKEIERWLATLNPDELRGKDLKELPVYNWKGNGWSLSFKPLAKSPGKRGQPGVRPIGIEMPESGFISSHIPIKRAIKKKAGKYGKLNLPYIVAVNVIDDFAETEDVIDALFGQQNLTVITKPDGSSKCFESRNPNGAWKAGDWQNTRVSAALIACNLGPSKIADMNPGLIHHPKAKIPLPPEAWQCKQRFLRTTKDHQVIKGKTCSQIIGLPDPWPVPDPDE